MAIIKVMTKCAFVAIGGRALPSEKDGYLRYEADDFGALVLDRESYIAAIKTEHGSVRWRCRCRVIKRLDGTLELYPCATMSEEVKSIRQTPLKCKDGDYLFTVTTAATACVKLECTEAVYEYALPHVLGAEIMTLDGAKPHFFILLELQKEHLLLIVKRERDFATIKRFYCQKAEKTGEEIRVTRLYADSLQRKETITYRLSGNGISETHDFYYGNNDSVGTVVSFFEALAARDYDKATRHVAAELRDRIAEISNFLPPFDTVYRVDDTSVELIDRTALYCKAELARVQTDDGLITNVTLE